MRRELSFVYMVLFFLVFLSACAFSNRTMESTPLSNPGTSAPIATSVAVTANPTLAQSSAIEAPIPSPTAENALAPETNPAGDIPDNQAFVTFSPPSIGYSLEVPEGWARTDQGSNVRFINKFDGVSVTLKSATSAPTAAGVQKNEGEALAQTERAFQVTQVSEVQLPGGKVVQITATANSDPDPVTGKQVRLEEAFYLFYQKGTLAVLKMWAPQGTDNVDQWKRISESFRWK